MVDRFRQILQRRSKKQKLMFLGGVVAGVGAVASVGLVESLYPFLLGLPVAIGVALVLGRENGYVFLAGFLLGYCLSILIFIGLCFASIDGRAIG